MIKNFNLYTNEEITLLNRDINIMMAKASEGRFNADTDPREICKELHEGLRELKDHINGGYEDFAKKSEMPINYCDSHFI